MSLADDLRLLSEIWHRTFGKVKCHRGVSGRCHVCSTTDWPVPSWVRTA